HIATGTSNNPAIPNNPMVPIPKIYFLLFLIDFITKTSFALYSHFRRYVCQSHATAIIISATSTLYLHKLCLFLLPRVFCYCYTLYILFELFLYNYSVIIDNVLDHACFAHY